MVSSQPMVPQLAKAIPPGSSGTVGEDGQGRYRDLFDLAPYGYYTVEQGSGTILENNRPLQRLLGYEVQELERRPSRVLFMPGEWGWEAASRAYSRAQSGETTETCEVQLCSKLGDAIWASLSVRPRFEEDGRLLEMRCAVLDIRERKRLEEERQRLAVEFRQAQKLESLGLLAGGVAHEFNNMLMTIMGNAEMIGTTLPEKSSQASYLLEIQSAGQRAAELCRQMLAYCGRGKIEDEPLRLSHLVAEIGDLLRVSLSPNVKLEMRLGRMLAPVLGDAKQIQQVVINLVANAGEAIGDRPGTVRLRTGVTCCDSTFLHETLNAPTLSPGDYLFIEVMDDGVGMSDEAKERMFDPFFSTKFAGRGLGMAAVSGIVRGHRGAIQTESESGEGTTLRVLLPVARTGKSTEGQPSSSVEVEEEEGGVILLADDETPVLNLARQMLEHLGYEVLAAQDGSEALEFYHQHSERLTAVILDLVMPGMGGEEVLVRIREGNQALPIIISSGYSEQEISLLLARDHLLGFLQKPYTLATLASTLNALLKEAEAEPASETDDPLFG